MIRFLLRLEPINSPLQIKGIWPVAQQSVHLLHDLSLKHVADSASKLGHGSCCWQPVTAKPETGMLTCWAKLAKQQHRFVKICVTLYRHASGLAINELPARACSAAVTLFLQELGSCRTPFC